MKEVPSKIEIRPRQHKTTGLWMALSRDLPGFVVHAHSEDELASKVPGALASYIRAIGGPDTTWKLERDEIAPGYTPSDFIAHSMYKHAA